MTTEQLKSMSGFIAWAEQGEAMGFLRALAEHIDTEVGDTGYANVSPHQANINLGIQYATRRVVRLVKDPLGRRTATQAAPRPSYGVVDDGKDAGHDWK